MVGNMLTVRAELHLGSGICFIGVRFHFGILTCVRYPRKGKEITPILEPARSYALHQYRHMAEIITSLKGTIYYRWAEFIERVARSRSNLLLSASSGALFARRRS